MNGADIIAFIILAAIVIAVLAYLLHWLYRRSSKDVSFVRTGLGGELIVMGGGALVLPIVHDVTEVSMNTLRLEVYRAREQALITKDRMRIELKVEFFVRVSPTPEAVATAARTLGNRTMNSESLKDLVQGRFVDAMGAATASMTLEQIHESRSAFVRTMREALGDSLSMNGLELEAVSLTNLDQADMKLFNPANAFDAEGLTRLTQEIESRKKKRNDIEQDTAVAIRQKNLESEKRSLEIMTESERSRLEQERDVAVERARQKAEIAAERAMREWEQEQAQIAAQERIERARIAKDRAIDEERIARETELERLEIERQKARELEEQEQVIAVALKSRLKSEAEAAAEDARALLAKAREKVSTVRELEIAERRRAIEIVEAEKAAERDAIKVVKAAEAQKSAAVERAEADRVEVAALENRYRVESAGKRALNEAENLRSDASRRSALHQRLVENLPEIIRESVKPIDKIDSIKILHVEGLPGLGGMPWREAATGGGGGEGFDAGAPRAATAANLAETVVNSALRYRTQAPFVDSLLNEIGISPHSINIKGLGALSDVSYTPPSDSEA